MHIWTQTGEDEDRLHRRCTLCGRKSSVSRFRTPTGVYNEPNPDVKSEVNQWLAERNYPIGSRAILLDADGLNTSSLLVENACFSTSNIVIPEYDSDTFERNKAHPFLGDSMVSGDFLETLKRMEPGAIGLIYADFTGHFQKWCVPLLDYLVSVNESLRPGLVIGMTWSNNGSGHLGERFKISHQVGGFFTKLGLHLTRQNIGYGHGANMNTVFAIKN